MFKSTSRRGSAKGVVLLLILAFLGAVVVGAGALFYFNRGKLDLTKKEKDEGGPQSSEPAASPPAPIQALAHA